MGEKNISGFKAACENYLSALSLSSLRAYGRHLQLRKPTALKKVDLIKEIVGVLCGETLPQRNNKGAPIKNDYVAPEISETVARLKAQYLCAAEAGDDGAAKPFSSVKFGAEEALKPPVSLQLVFQPSALNEKQKQLLNDFLNSL